jgi:hypothetical protein
MPSAMRDNKRVRTERAGKPEANRPQKQLNFEREHCCYVWITLIDLSLGKSCPSRAAIGEPGTVAPRTLQWGPGGGRKNLRPSAPRTRRRSNFDYLQVRSEFASNFKWLFKETDYKWGA